MRNPTKSNYLISSRLVLAMAMAPKAPSRARFANLADRKRMAVDRLATSCESLRKRSRELLVVLKAREAEFSADAVRIPSARADVAATVKSVALQIELHKRMESILDEVTEIIAAGRDSIS